MEGKRGRGRPRQKLLDWMMEDRYKKLKANAQHGEEWRVTGQNGMDKRVQTKWYGKNFVDSNSTAKCSC